MTEPSRPRVKYVIGPDGSPLTIADLPPPSTRRWVIRRKAEVVAAVRGGLLSLEEACKRYTLTTEEFLSWQFSIDQHGLAGCAPRGSSTTGTEPRQRREWGSPPMPADRQVQRSRVPDPGAASLRFGAPRTERGPALTPR